MHDRLQVEQRCLEQRVDYNEVEVPGLCHLDARVARDLDAVAMGRHQVEVAAIAIAVEIVAGIALIVGFKARWAALALAIFTLATALLFHNYWTLPADKQFVDMLMFWKNLAITGGLLIVFAFGAGGWSFDARSGKS